MAEKTNKNTVDMNKVELLVTIVDRSKAEYYVDLIQSFDVNMQFTVFGRGTAGKDVLSLLKMASSEKAVIFSVIRADKIKDAIRTLDNKFKTIRNGKGIAYTLPISSVIGVAIFAFLSNNQQAVKESK